MRSGDWACLVGTLFSLSLELLESSCSKDKDSAVETSISMEFEKREKAEDELKP